MRIELVGTVSEVEFFAGVLAGLSFVRVKCSLGSTCSPAACADRADGEHQHRAFEVDTPVSLAEEG